jgi:DNA-binding SARP family transcriptional activator
MTQRGTGMADGTDRAAGTVLHLLAGPYVTVDGRRWDPPEASRRLLVFAALHAGRCQRGRVAALLWPSCDEARSAGNLRSSLWRLRAAGTGLLDADKSSIGLSADVVVDVQLVSDRAARLIRGTAGPEDLVVNRTWTQALDLLPGWYDDWALVERERIRQRVLHGLEALSRALVRRGRCAEAIEASLAAVGAEPLRESAYRTLLEAHLAEGNLVEARRAFDAYRELVHRELGVQPSPDLFAMVRSVREARGPLTRLQRLVVISS